MAQTVNRNNSFWKTYRFPAILFGAIILGSIIGLVMGEKATVLKPLGDIFLNLMFTVVVPLVFVTVAGAVSSMLDMRRLGKILGVLLAVFTITGAIAAVIILIAVKIYPPAQGVTLTMPPGVEMETVTFTDAVVKAVTVEDFRDLLSRRNMLPLIVFSILVGFCVSTVCGRDSLVTRVLDDLSKVMMKVVDVIMLYAPIGLGAYFASLVGEFGPQLLGAYGRAMLLYYPICILYFLICFPLYAYFSGGMPAVRRMFRFIIPPTVTSLATQSSIATLPVNLEAAANIGVPKDIREIVLPIGATMHMEGSVLSAILKIAFLFGIYGHDFSGVGLYAITLVIAIMSGVVMSGVPGGGLIGEMLIISLFGFPLEAFPIIATIGFLVDPPATCINATGDTVSAMVITRVVEGPGWMNKAAPAEADCVMTK